MFMDTEKNAEEYGLLRYSHFYKTDATTNCISMSVLYFADSSGLHRYDHPSKTHRAGWK
jgi:hypothetical protein